MKLSVLLPVYNGENYIKKAIDSVLKNSYKNIELIVINDGSKDLTLEILNSIPDDRLKIFSKENSGLIDTLNYGINKCNSEIIMRMDSDDLIHPNKIEIQLSAFLKSKSILMGTSGYLIDSSDSICGTINLPTQNKQIIKSMMHFNPSIIHPSVMSYKSVIKKAGFYSDFMKHAEDYDLFLRLSRYGKLSNLSNKLIYLRKGEHNISHNNTEEQILNTQIAKDFYKLNSDNLISLKVYEALKERNLKNPMKNLHININAAIVKNEHISDRGKNIKLIFFKVLRRILKFFI